MGRHKNVEKMYNKIIEHFRMKMESFWPNFVHTYPYQKSHLQELRGQLVPLANDLKLNEQFVTELSMLRYGNI